MSGNLPPGTTPADVDAAMAPPAETVARGLVDVGVEIEVSGNLETDAIEAAMMAAVREALDEADDRVIQVVNAEAVEVIDR